MMYLFGPSGLMMEFRPPFLRRGRRSRIRNARRIESCQMIRRSRISNLNAVQNRRSKNIFWSYGNFLDVWVNNISFLPTDPDNEFAFSPPSKPLPSILLVVTYAATEGQKKKERKKRGPRIRRHLRSPKKWVTASLLFPCLNLSLHPQTNPRKRNSRCFE